MNASSGENGPRIVGRGAQIDPKNRFERLEVELHDDDDHEAEQGGSSKVATQYYDDDSKSILSENDSPDIPFRYSLNPYRGCAHGCAYCYARPTHEYLGFSAGVEFESKIMVKRRASELLEKQLRKKSWQAEPIMLSGVTDCYQPIERQLKLTRSCLEVMRRFGQPLGIVTKNALVHRDLDILAPMAAQNLARVAVSLTSLDQSLTRRLEPRTSSPEARLKTIQRLAEAGVGVTVMVAPVIPGLNDAEVPAILKAAKEHGAAFANYVLLRLPLTVEPVFWDWLARNRPSESDKILSLVRQTRSGKMNQSEFGSRMRGTGPIADYIRNLFHIQTARLGLERKPPALERTLFCQPKSGPTQLELF